MALVGGLTNLLSPLLPMLNILPCLLGSLTLKGPLPPRAVAACSAIAAGTRIETQIWPGQCNPDYSEAQSHYWSNANADNVPACAVFPTCANDISCIIRILAKYPDVNFAVKSGGHNANVGFSSVDGGVLISLAHMNTTTLSPDKKSADVQPGARWENVITALDPYDLAVVGGRVGDVGVGGLLLGCGLSFLSGQYGLPCDNRVLSYEVILSDGTIVDASATSHPDLFWALKGGGNQFGIVSKFTLRTYQIGQVWGGVRLYSPQYVEAILNATQDFTQNNDPCAGIILSMQIIIDGLIEFIALFMFYNGQQPPRGGIFAKFDAIPFTSDTTRTQSYSSLLTSNNNLASLYGFRYILRGSTIPNLPGSNGTDLLNANYNLYSKYVRSMGIIPGLLEPGFAFILIYQPVPYTIANASVTVNPMGNLLGLSPESGDHIWMASTVSWLTVAGDSIAHTAAAKILDDITTYTKTQYDGVQSSNFQGGSLAQEYAPPIFMNDAMYNQQVLQGYGNSTYARLKVIQQLYDPTGTFPSRTDGFK